MTKVALLPFSTDPEAIEAMYAHWFPRRTKEVPTSFARSALAVLNAVVACNFEVPRALFAQLAHPTESRNTLYDVLATMSYEDFSRWVNESRRTAWAQLVQPADPYIWLLPVHLHLVRPHAKAPFNSWDNPDLSHDLERFDPEAARLYYRDAEAFVERCGRPFLEWRFTQNLDRVNRNCGAVGPHIAIEILRDRFLPHNDFYQTCIDRVGCLGLQFRLVGISEVITKERVSMSHGSWLPDVRTNPKALNVVVTTPGASQPSDGGDFASLPQSAARYDTWHATLQRKILGLISVQEGSLGHVRGAERAFGRESGHLLTHELGHLFQLHHLGSEHLSPVHLGRDDFDYPCIGVASDTIWRPPSQRSLSIRPEKLSFVHGLHSRAMYLNTMSAIPESDDSLFFTRGQSARARLFAQLHYGHLIERGDPWPEATQWVGHRDMSPVALCQARFDAMYNPLQLQRP